MVYRMCEVCVWAVGPCGGWQGTHCTSRTRDAGLVPYFLEHFCACQCIEHLRARPPPLTRHGHAPSHNSHMSQRSYTHTVSFTLWGSSASPLTSGRGPYLLPLRLCPLTLALTLALRCTLTLLALPEALRPPQPWLRATSARSGQQAEATPAAGSSCPG